MFKLVAVGGKIRGEEYNLKDGDNLIGRSPENDFQIKVDGISKKHLRITVNEDSVYVEDLGSSNGTIINGRVIKNATLKDGDKIVLPNIILQLVYVLEKKKLVKRKVAKEVEHSDENFNEPIPNTIAGKLIWVFKYKFPMPVIYSFNQSYEWNAMTGILLFLLILTNITSTIIPVLEGSKVLLIREIALRGKQYAAEVDRLNRNFLRDKNLDSIYTNFLEGEEGVKEYALYDTDGRIYRPINKLNSIVNEPFQVQALNFFKTEANQDKEVVKSLGDNTIGIARAIKAYNKVTGRDEVVAIIAINFSPGSLAREAANNKVAYLESLIVASMFAIIFFGIFYYMTSRPIDEMRNQIEQALRGKVTELNSKTLFRELRPLREIINSLLSRIREYEQNAGGEFQGMEDEAPYIRMLKEFLDGCPGPCVVLNSEKKLQYANLQSEDLLGIRENSAAGQELLDIFSNKGLAATMIELCDRSANEGGANCKEIYDISGKQISINVTSLMGKDSFVKGHLITFISGD